MPEQPHNQPISWKPVVVNSAADEEPPYPPVPQPGDGLPRNANMPTNMFPFSPCFVHPTHTTLPMASAAHHPLPP